MRVLSEAERMEIRRRQLRAYPVPFIDRAGQGGWTQCPYCLRVVHRVCTCHDDGYEYARDANIVYVSGYLVPHHPISPFARYSLDELRSLGDEGELSDGMRFRTIDGQHYYEAQPRVREDTLYGDYYQEIVEVKDDAEG